MVDKKPIELDIFPSNSRLCTYFKYVKFSINPNYPALKMRLSFSFPFIKPPNMIPSIDDSLLHVFSPTALPLKPEAPWIKRTEFGIKFTDEILQTEYDEFDNI
jgi:hypothetical protein